MAKKKTNTKEDKPEKITLKDYDEAFLREHPEHPHHYLVEEKDAKEE